MKTITLAEALRLFVWGEDCLSNNESDYPRSTKNDLIFIDLDYSNSKKCDEGARRTAKVIFKENEKLYAFEVIDPYWDEGDIDIKLTPKSGDTFVHYGDEYANDKSITVDCVPVIRKTRVIKQVYYE